MSFLNSLQNKSKKFDDPFLHWELDKPLTDEQINEIVKADIANPIEHDLNYDGTRAIDGGAPEFRKGLSHGCLLYTSPSPRDLSTSRMPSSA